MSQKVCSTTISAETPGMSYDSVTTILVLEQSAPIVICTLIALE